MSDKWRRKKEPKHVRVYATITDSEAWEHLSGNSVKVLLALCARDDGTRNGAISFSVREAADATGLGERTSWRCFAELQENGFIACTQKGAFSRKVSHASLWRYTWAAWPGGHPAAPTRDFEKWRCMEIRGCKICSRAVAVSDQPSGNIMGPVAKSATDAMETPLVSVTPHPAKYATHISNQGLGLGAPETEQWKPAYPCPAADLGEPAKGDPSIANTQLRDRLIAHLQQREPGDQRRLADSIGIPPGTLSKFIHGKNLPERYRAPLADAVTVEAMERKAKATIVTHDAGPSERISSGWIGSPEQVLAGKIAAGGKAGEHWAAMSTEKALAKIVVEQKRRARERMTLERRRA